MATSQTPLILNTSPIRKNSLSKIFLYVLLSFIAIVGSIALLNATFINKTHPSFNPLTATHFCDNAHNRVSCIHIVSEAASSGVTNNIALLQSVLDKSVSQVKDTIERVNDIHHRVNDPRAQAALADCLELMDLSKDRLEDTMVALANGNAQSHSDAHAWLSSVLTNHVTCQDGLNGPAKSIMEPTLEDLISRARTSLAIVVALSPSPSKADVFLPLYGTLPSWVTIKDRKLLESSPNGITANVVVAKDGSGKFKTIKEAVASAPDKGSSRYTIHIKAGTYKENVEIGKSKKNLMLVGDGMDKTIITGNLNVIDGSTTFNSATVAVSGDGFIAQDIWFQNTAGPEKHQAVALRVSADQSVINRCRIEAFQDTLYTHTLRQFYRDCYITGTVDFIFGNAAVVFQNSKLAARKPMTGQKNMITAQGRTDPNQNTGISIQNCDVIPSSDLLPVKGSIKTYLGRPWKEYSRTVYMQSNIGDHIDPSGWSEWSGSFALNTLYYGEYLNRGAGAGTAKRVKWAGFHVIKNAAEAQKFTVGQMIQGGVWLKNTGVTYTEGL